MSPVISSDVPEELAERVDEESEADESRSATVRRLIRTGLSHQDQNGIHLTYPAAIGLIGWAFVIAAFMDTTPTAGYAGIVILTITILYEIAYRTGIMPDSTSTDKTDSSDR